ncbi:MAG: hypothetical protein E3K32_08295 [wastewater metagenome]|nr:hypothetical protein [Candidatus Loosdrechtia aerotolerans]
MRCIFIVNILFFIITITSHVPSEETHAAEIFIHQGILEDIPENTFAALRRAVELGVDGIQVDVRKTKDNQLILMCDETIDRTTDGKGRVDTLLYAEIQQYDAGSWRGAEFRNERVPLLSDVLKFCKVNNLKLILNARQVCLEKQVVDLVRSHEMFSRIYLWGTLRNLNREEPESSIKELVLVIPEELSAEKVARIQEEKKYVLSTILNSDTRKTIKDRIRTGADVILVDYPCVALDILGIKSPVITNKTPVKNTEREKSGARQEVIQNPAFIQGKIKVLIKNIKGEDYDKARTAAMALMALPQEYVVPSLIKLIQGSYLSLFRGNHPSAKQHAVWALGFCSTPDVASYIHPLLKEKNPEMRREAALALGRLGNVQSVPVLLEALKTEMNPEVKYDIIRALGMIGDHSAVFTLFTILTEEKYWYIKSAAVQALLPFRHDKAVRVLADTLTTDAGEDAAWTRTMAAWVLAVIGKKSIPELINALRDNEEATRRRAAWALIKIGTPAVKSLIHSLRDPNTFARERAAEALGWIGDTSAVTALIWALKDEELSVVGTAAWALGRIGDPHALPALKLLSRNKDNDIRENVNEAIERIAAKKENMVYNKKSVRKP